MSQLHPSLGSQNIQPFGTYEASEILIEEYGRGKTGVGLTDRGLDWYIQYPVDAPPDIELPILFMFSGGGYRVTQFEEETYNWGTYANGQFTFYEPFVTAGMILVGIDNRAGLDASPPWNNNDGPSDTIMRKSIRAMWDYDQPLGLNSFLQPQNRLRAAFRGDRRRCFIIGWSAGGTSVIRQILRYPGRFLGGINFTGGFAYEGHNFPDPDPTTSDATADVRSALTEDAIDADTDPLLLFLTGNDFAIDGPSAPFATYNLALATRAQMFPQNVVYWDDEGSVEAGGHDCIETFENVMYGGDLVTPAEACRRWMRDRITADGGPDSGTSKVVLA